MSTSRPKAKGTFGGNRTPPHESFVPRAKETPSFGRLRINLHKTFDVFGYPVEVNGVPVPSEDEHDICGIRGVRRAVMRTIRLESCRWRSNDGEIKITHIAQTLILALRNSVADKFSDEKT